jgi:hypothetical protein
VPSRLPAIIVIRVSVMSMRIVTLIVITLYCLSLAIVAQAQSRIDAAYFDGAVSELPQKKPGKLDASGDAALRFEWEKGEWKVPYTQVKTIYIALSRHSVLGEAFGLAGAAAGAMKKRKLMLALLLVDEQGRQRRCVFFLPYAASHEFVDAMEKKSGRKVVYESEEARLAIESRSDGSPGRNNQHDFQSER